MSKCCHFSIERTTHNEYRKRYTDTDKHVYLQEVNLAYENVKEVDGLDVSKEGADAWEAAIKR